MTEEELIKEAKRRYPIGCKFKSAYSGDRFTLENDNFYVDDKYVRCNQSQKPIIYLKNSNTWAEIIFYPKDSIPPISHELINSYIL